jgi:hypothetical protein
MKSPYWDGLHRACHTQQSRRLRDKSPDLAIYALVQALSVARIGHLIGHIGGQSSVRCRRFRLISGRRMVLNLKLIANANRPGRDHVCAQTRSMREQSHDLGRTHFPCSQS